MRPRLVRRSLRFYARSNLAVALGAAVGTAVLTGALVVGDSMRGSLRRLTLQRLGHIDLALRSEGYLPASAAARLESHADFRRRFRAALPAVILSTSIETDEEPARRAGRVQLVGCPAAFWSLGAAGPTQPPSGAQVVINRTLAEQLGAAVGQTLLLRLPKPGTIPAETPLGRKRDTVEIHRVILSEILADEGLGRFELQANQQPPRNAFVALDWLQQRLDRAGAANTILVAGHGNGGDGQQAAALAEMWRPGLADFGLRLRKTRLGYLDLGSPRMLLPPPLEQPLLAALGGQRVQPAITWLANEIERDGHSIPYSTISGVDFSALPPLGPMTTIEGRPAAALGDDEIALNEWAADDLGARVGDRIGVRYFEPETGSGTPAERRVELRLAAIVRLAGAAADRNFIPDVPGVTDQRSMSNWDPPFPFDAARIRSQDEQYWDKERGTPKAFVSLATGRRLWASRFGQTTTLRIAPLAGQTAESLSEQLAAALRPEMAGLIFQPVKAQGLAASARTTPFQWLFLAFSAFLIAAAAMLVALLFRLGIERRWQQIGILLALGFTRSRVRRLLLAEGLLVAAAGGLVGIVAGLVYAAGLLAALESWWLGAISARFLVLDFTWASLAGGFAGGLWLAAVAIVWSVAGAGRRSPRALLAGWADERLAALPGRRRRWARWIPPVVLLLALVLPLLLPAAEETRALAFFLSGAAALGALLALAAGSLRRGAVGAAVAVGRGNLVRLALRNAARNPGRSTLTAGLIAAASFLVIATSAFRLDPERQTSGRDSPGGSFALVAESDQPVYLDLNKPADRTAAGLSQARLKPWPARVFSFRVNPGDDASCLNLYQPRQPRVLGVPPAFLDRGGLAWAEYAAPETPGEDQNPWRLLDRPTSTDPDGVLRVPAVLDKNTATYSLHLGGIGATLEIRDGGGRPLRLEVVGLLANSLFQGDVLIAEPAFLRCFPGITGRRFFLVEAPPEQVAALARVLEQSLGEYGLTTETTTERLARFYAVQNTYLSTFQSLGALGLLLGTLGLAAVQLRNVWERRAELALLRAVGFRRRQLGLLVFWETCLLLVGGLGAALLAAFLAVLPHIVRGGAGVPWAGLGAMLAGMVLVGLLAGLGAVRAALAVPLVATLRGE